MFLRIAVVRSCTCIRRVDASLRTRGQLRSMPPKLATRIQCNCARCSKSPLVVFHTKRTITRHVAKYGEHVQPHVNTLNAAGSPVPSSLLNPRVIAVNQQVQVNQEDGRMIDDYGSGPALGFMDEEFENEEFQEDPMQENEVPQLPVAPPSPPAPIQAPANNATEIFDDVEPPIDLDLGIGIDEDDSDTIPVMKEKAYMRLTYLQAVLGNVFGKLTWERATEQLRTTLRILSMAGSLPVAPQPVSTLQSARRRLGIDPDAYIVQYSICPRCSKHYTPLETTNLASANCTNPHCAGSIFTINTGNRVPILINPQVSIIGSLRRMFLRRGFAQMVERKLEHQPGETRTAIS
jgi:hypothetical protein